MVNNVARQGNCFTYNSEYNFEDKDLYREEEDGYYETGKRRLSSLTGPSFGLNLVITLDQTNYMEGEITTQVCQLLKSVEFIELFWSHSMKFLSSSTIIITLGWRNHSH